MLNPLQMMELLRKFDVKTQELLRLIFILAFIHFSQIINAQNSNPINTDTTSEIVGPFSGYLVLTGGGMHAASLKKFVELCGKKNPLIVVITSAGTIEKKGETTYIQIRSMFKDAGTENVKIYFHLDSNESKSDSMYNYLAKADGVWFTGGRQWRLADIYLNKRFINSIQSILNREGLVRRLSILNIEESVVEKVALADLELEMGARGLNRNIEKSITYFAANQLVKLNIEQPIIINLILEDNELIPEIIPLYYIKENKSAIDIIFRF